MTEWTLDLAEATDGARVGRRAGMLAVLAAAGSLPVAPGCVVPADATARAASEPEAFAAALGVAWERLGRPGWVRVVVEPAGHELWRPEDAASPPGGERRRVRRAAELARVVRDELAASGPATASAVVLASRVADARGRVWSEDPREDRVEEVHVDAWLGDAPPTGAGAVHYRQARAGGPVATERDAGAGVALPSGAVTRLVALALEAESALLEPVGLEWSLRGSEVQIDGVTPIATPLPWGIVREAARPEDVWTRTNAGEVFPRPMTPMTWSLMGAPLDEAFAAMYQRPQWTAGRRFVALVAGYVYFNFGLVNHLTVDRLGFPAREMAEAVGGPGEAEGFRATDRGLHWPSVLRNLGWALERTRAQRRLPQRWEAMEREAAERRARLRALDVGGMPDAALLAELERTGEWLRGLASFLMEAQSAAFGSFGLLSYMLSSYLGDSADAPALIQGLPGIRTTEGNVELWRLARRAADDAVTRRLVEETPPEDLLEALRAEPAAAWLAAALAAFLAEYGHRSAGELEVSEPRWSDAPALILRPFREYVLRPGDRNAEEQFRQQAARRAEAEARIRARLSRRWFDRLIPIRRALVADQIRWTQTYAPLRENPKFSFLALVQEQRRLLFGLARRLVARGVFVEDDDVFFLFREELAALVGEPDDDVLAGRLRSRVARRRAQLTAWQAVQPPAVLGAEPRVPPEAARGAAPRSAGGRVLRGLAASPGVAEGEAFVAADAEEAQALRAGQVLVARFTDPGWTPIFPLAAAVVTDIGGRLSHGAIVAREYGIPAVVNVREATATIRPGERLRVDGTRGTVERLDVEAAEAASGG